jgi:acyl-CoA reductase-like NAD-dependent aldehyde dehydrogenase
VQAGAFDEFASKLAEKVAQFKIGNGLDSKTYADPCIADNSRIRTNLDVTALTAR